MWYSYTLQRDRGGIALEPLHIIRARALGFPDDPSKCTFRQVNLRTAHSKEHLRIRSLIPSFCVFWLEEIWVLKCA